MNYDVVISFAGENRDVADTINNGLKKSGVETFYDDDHKATLWGKNLAEELSRIYEREGRYCLIIISQHYLQKMWPRLERRSAIARMIRQREEYVLPYIVDKTRIDEVKGLSPDTHFIKAENIEPTKLVDMILEKLGYPKSTSTWIDESPSIRIVKTIIGPESYRMGSCIKWPEKNPIFEIRLSGERTLGAVGGPPHRLDPIVIITAHNDIRQGPLGPKESIVFEARGQTYQVRSLGGKEGYDQNSH